MDDQLKQFKQASNKTEYKPTQHYFSRPASKNDTNPQVQYDSEGAVTFVIVVILFYGLSIPCLIGIFISSKKEHIPFDRRNYLKEINRVRDVALRTERLRMLRRAIKHRGSLAEYVDSPSAQYARTTLGSVSSEQAMTPTLSHAPTNPQTGDSAPGQHESRKNSQNNEQEKVQRLNIIDEDPKEGEHNENKDNVFDQLEGIALLPTGHDSMNPESKDVINSACTIDQIHMERIPLDQIYYEIEV